MISHREIPVWLASLPPTCDIAVDEGGLSLVVLHHGRTTATYLEVGGLRRSRGSRQTRRTRCRIPRTPTRFEQGPGLRGLVPRHWKTPPEPDVLRSHRLRPR